MRLTAMPLGIGRRSSAATKLKAIEHVQGWIEFSPQGVVLDAGDTFLRDVGYARRELLGQHHRVLCDPGYVASPAYADLWARLQRGESDAGIYPRRRKDGTELWLQASYTPVRGLGGRVRRVLTFATDITVQQKEQAAAASRLAAVDRSQAVIEFDLQGVVREANANFLAAMGYTLDEIVGRHHRMFCDPSYATSTDYADFWRRLRAGEPFVGTYRRLAKGGREVWIQGSYNPLLDANGHAYGVVKVVTDVTAEMQGRRELEGLVEEAGEVLQAVAAGDLTRSVMGQYGGSLAALAGSINATIGTLATTMTSVDARCASTAEAVSQVAQGTEDLAQRTHAQVSALEETAAAIQELTASVTRNAGDARTADSLGRETRTIAEQASQVTTEATSAMAQISESGRRISEITSVIDGIAFQTNLLALNAAVEAARAGDQGRGFAVVADEVRSLALRSATAAKEIGALIDETLRRVGEGNRLVTDTATTLDQITSAVQQVTDLIARISATSREQAAGIAQVNEAIGAMDGANQQNATLVEQLSAATQSLRDDADRLRDTVSTFTLASTRPSTPSQSPTDPRRTRLAPKDSSPRLERPTLSGTPLIPGDSFACSARVKATV